MMSLRSRLLLLLCLVSAAVASTGGAFAQDATWKVKNRLQGKIKDGAPEKSSDVSGIACMPGPATPRLCLVIDDETQGAHGGA